MGIDQVLDSLSKTIKPFLLHLLECQFSRKSQFRSIVPPMCATHKTEYHSSHKSITGTNTTTCGQSPKNIREFHGATYSTIETSWETKGLCPSTVSTSLPADCQAAYAPVSPHVQQSNELDLTGKCIVWLLLSEKTSYACGFVAICT